MMQNTFLFAVEDALGERVDIRTPASDPSITWSSRAKRGGQEYVIPPSLNVWFSKC